MLPSPDVPDASGRDAYWAVPADALVDRLDTSAAGLTPAEAAAPRTHRRPPA